MAKPEDYAFYCRVKINSGARAMEHIPVELEAMDAGKPMLVTDEQALAGKVVRAFRDSGMTVGVFDKLPPEPDGDLIAGLAAVYRDNHCDALIALGSGPIVDAVKAINVLVSTGRDRLASTVGTVPLDGPLNPLIFLPTSSADGLETAHFAIVGNTRITSPYLMPDLAVIDPRLFQPIDHRKTAAAAMSALTHAAETSAAASGNPLAAAYATTAVELIRENLLSVVNNGSDKKGRMALANAAVMTGCALSNAGMGMAGQLGAAAAVLSRVAPGVCKGILLAYALEYQTLKIGSQTADLLLPLAGSERYAGTAENLRGPIAVNTIYALVYDLNKTSRGSFPLTLREAGIDKELLEPIIEHAFDDNGVSADRNGCETVLAPRLGGPADRIALIIIIGKRPALLGRRLLF